MNTTTYQQRAMDTKKRRQARGHYRKPSEAFKKYCAKGVDALNETEKGIVRAELLAMRVSVNW